MFKPMLFLFFFLVGISPSFGADDLYTVMGLISKNVSQDAIEKRYGELKKRGAVSLEVQKAYEVLKDVEKRKHYDLEQQLMTARRDLLAKYELNNSKDPDFSKKFLLMVKEQNARARKRSEAKGFGDPSSAEKEILFFDHYPKDDTYRLVLKVVEENLNDFLKSVKDKKEVFELLEILNQEAKVNEVSSEVYYSRRASEAADFEIEQIIKRSFNLLAISPKFFKESEHLDFLAQWIETSEPSKNDIQKWADTFKSHFRKKNMDEVWEALLKSGAWKKHSGVIADAFSGLIAGDKIIDAIIEFALTESKTTKRKELEKIIAGFSKTLDFLARTDKEAQRRIASMGGPKKFILSLFSPTARCEWIIRKTVRSLRESTGPTP